MKKRLYLLLSVMLLSLTAIGREGHIGVPFFTNFTSQQYKGHNRNFDILCDKEGHTFVGNFEGLLIYNNVEWQIVHTPGISRITKLSQKDGKVWFEGYNVKGYVEQVDGDSIRVQYVKSDSGVNEEPVAENSETLEEKVDRWNGIEVHQRLSIAPDYTILATATAGIVAIDDNEHAIYSIGEEEGLCSNNVSAIAYDGKGCVWGATDNGLFRINVSLVYTVYDNHEGLDGQVTCVLQNNGKLYVGTLLGLYQLEGNSFTKIEGINQACWQIVRTDNGKILIAGAEGVYILENKLRQISSSHALTVFPENDQTFLVGQLNGIYRYKYAGGEGELVDAIENTSKLASDGQGGIWGLTVYGKHYYLKRGAAHFEEKQSGPLSVMFEYKDDLGNSWHGDGSGLGLKVDGKDAALNQWMKSLSELNVQTMEREGDVAYIGGNFGLIRIDLELMRKNHPELPKVFVRRFVLDGRDLSFTISEDKVDVLGQTQYSYRLHNGDKWSRWTNEQEMNFLNLEYGFYELKVRAMDAYGNIIESDVRKFDVPAPIYMRWYAYILYFLILAYVVQRIVKYRTERLRKEQIRLENIVSERTQEVVQQKDEIEAQKDEIEAKSHELEQTLVELKETQNELVRKEREATVGKLTKGLIDRILNPMNYINNFSHLSLGLTKDISDNLQSLKDGMADGAEQDEIDDLFDDSTDVVSMMQQNLEKIEQHGLSTTRILKAMEEMLKERSDKFEETDIVVLLQRDIDRLKKYFAEDISKYGIQIEWQKPETPMMAVVNAELISRSFMSIIMNSVYALKKRAEKKQEGYSPVLRFGVRPAEGHIDAIQVSFYDNGIGIEESIIDKIYDPFFTTKPTAEAPGVGLYLCQQIIQDIGGHIEAKSEKDKFTEFIITLWNRK